MAKTPKRILIATARWRRKRDRARARERRLQVLEARRQRVACIAEALFGPNWHKPLAAELGISPRTTLCWLQGRKHPDDKQVYWVEDVARRKVMAIGAALRKEPATDD